MKSDLIVVHIGLNRFKSEPRTTSYRDRLSFHVRIKEIDEQIEFCK